MRRPKHYLRTILLVWRHPSEVAIVLAVCTVIFLFIRHTPEANVQSNASIQRRFMHLFGQRQDDIIPNVLEKQGSMQHYVQKRSGAQNKDVNQQILFGEFKPKLYPKKVNMTVILRQYEIRGYADEKPINVFDNSYIINPNHTCNQLHSPRVLFIVKSSPKNNVLRVTIRETWGNEKRFPSIRTIFLLMIPNNDKMLLNLLEESAMFNDILLMYSDETNYNLTLRTVNGLKWAVTFCPEVKYVILTDDNAYVAPDLLLSFLNKQEVNGTENLYSGQLMANALPIRGGKSPWFVTKSEYPFSTYPKYIHGGFVIMSMPTVRKLTFAALYTKLFKFETFYLAILAARTGIEAQNNWYVSPRKVFTTSELFKSQIAAYNYHGAAELQRAWDCHLSELDQDENKAIFCDYIVDRIQKIQPVVDQIINLMKGID